MSDDHHSDGPFDPDDPLTGMGIAMVGMALQEAAEEEERQRRSRLASWDRAQEDRRNKDQATKLLRMMVLAAVAFLVLLMCVILPLQSCIVSLGN